MWSIQVSVPALRAGWRGVEVEPGGPMEDIQLKYQTEGEMHVECFITVLGMGSVFNK